VRAPARARGAAATALAVALLAAGPARAGVPVPALSGPVVDEAGLLSRPDAARLERLARAAREQRGGKGPQLQFVIVRTLAGEPIEDFTIRLAEAWKVGEAARDDGVIVAVASEDRQVRIEVGNGVEGGLTDAQSSRIIRGTIAPAFQAGRFGDGLYDAGVQILAALGALPQGVSRPAPPHAARSPVIGFLIFLVITSVLRGFLGFGLRRRRHLWWGGGPWIGGGWGGGGLGGRGGGGGWSGGGGGFSGGGASGRW
jgi:uncharacterized protein